MAESDKTGRAHACYVKPLPGDSGVDTNKVSGSLTYLNYLDQITRKITQEGRNRRPTFPTN